jgi:hypothetical protein
VSARDLRARTGGNPFFIEEVVRGLVENHRPGDEDRSDLGLLGVPQGIAEVITRRLDRLSDRSRKVIVMASVIRPEFNLSLVEVILKLLPGDVLESLEEPIRDGLIVEVSTKHDRFAFSHALVRETQYDRLIGSRRVCAATDRSRSSSSVKLRVLRARDRARRPNWLTTSTRHARWSMRSAWRTTRSRRPATRGGTGHMTRRSLTTIAPELSLLTRLK